MTFLEKAQRYYHTLRYVKPIQVFYQFKYRFNRVSSLKKITPKSEEVEQIPMLPLPAEKKIIQISDSGIKVTVLNQETIFQNKIDWADNSYGQLWNYHLQYADFLKQEDLTVNEKENLIADLYQWLTSGKLTPEPYPASLRIMNLIRFLSTHKEIKKKDELADYLYSELHFLENRMEYHLLGNHLMENAFAILMGGVFFQKEEWIDLAEKIFSAQVPEQILTDGGHFERSPMYHLIILFRFLEAVYYLPPDSELHPLFLENSKNMIGWMDQMSFQNGDLAHFNDSTDDQSYSKKQILQMAEECRITEYQSLALNDSGYRRFDNGSAELLVDVCGIKPDYQPGHAHADSLSFILYFDGIPIIVDPGVSTYEAGERRNWERSTKAHNTVTFKDENTADVWGKFRVGRRPYIQILKETDSEWELRLKYTLKSGVHLDHIRCVTGSQKHIDISETVNLNDPVNGRLHFHPNIKIQELTGNKVILSNSISIIFQNVQEILQFSYSCSKGFNHRSKSIGIRYRFKNNISFRIIFPST